MQLCIAFASSVIIVFVLHDLIKHKLFDRYLIYVIFKYLIANLFTHSWIKRKREHKKKQEKSASKNVRQEKQESLSNVFLKEISWILWNLGNIISKSNRRKFSRLFLIQFEHIASSISSNNHVGNSLGLVFYIWILLVLSILCLKSNRIFKLLYSESETAQIQDSHKQ